MIPLIYRAREEIEVVKRADRYLLVSEAPLNVVQVNERVFKIFNMCHDSATITDIASRMGMREERVLEVCTYLNHRAILELLPPVKGDYLPTVSVIIPVKDRHEELLECLDGVFAVDYPEEKLEVIVIDDGSKDRIDPLPNDYRWRVLRNSICQGQSYSRNLGAKDARGEILAFLDSDCVPSKNWLSDLVSPFQWDRISAVGGYVEGYFEYTSLDRYERTFSPLNLGRYIILDRDGPSTFYIPTCNLLVRKVAFKAVGGLKRALKVGEDVDLCWRLREKGDYILYIPAGSVKHRHRNELRKMLKRRFEYGTSEAILYKIHPQKRKMVQLPFWATLSALSIIIAILFLSVIPLLGVISSISFEVIKKVARLKDIDCHPGIKKILLSVVRSHFSFLYLVFFHLIRYYLVALFAGGLLFPRIWIIAILGVLISSLVDYTRKRPMLSFPVFVLFYTLEHIFYQIGVLFGAIKERSFGTYIPKFVRKLIPFH